MISVNEALGRITSLLSPLSTEYIPLRVAASRVLAEDVVTKRNQPPFAASSMDGYAVQGAEVAAGASFEVIGESAAGSRFSGDVKSSQAVRIFTGAPVPQGADRVVIQEDTDRVENMITIREDAKKGPFVRPVGNDFAIGDRICAPKRLNENDVALLAAMNIAEVPVFRRPVVALVATGDELVMPGENPGEDQIIASNIFGLSALLEQHGAEIRLLPIAKDTPDSLKSVFRLCQGADLIVTIGGTSVGEHDIVKDVASEMGLETYIFETFMRPGKPLIAGAINGTPMVGLPGNPVSSMVCGHVFLRPALSVMQGLGSSPVAREMAQLDIDIGKNGDGEHYMRATLTTIDGQLTVRPASRQGSALLSVLSEANALMVRPPNDPAKTAGSSIEVIRLHTGH